MVFKLIYFLLLFGGVLSLRIFLIGGNTDEKDILVYQQLAGSIPSRPPQVKCDTNWNITKCPRIAVATSAAPTA